MRNGHIVGTPHGRLGPLCDPDIAKNDIDIEFSDIEYRGDSLHFNTVDSYHQLPIWEAGDVT